MIRGVSFIGPNKWYSVLRMLTKNIDIKKYSWFIAYEDVIGQNDQNYFNSDRYSGEEFEKIILDESCYAISLELLAFPEITDFEKIQDYNEFVRSKCEIIILIDDNVYIYVYAKDIDIIERFKNNAESNDFENIGYITDENDIITHYWS